MTKSLSLLALCLVGVTTSFHVTPPQPLLQQHRLNSNDQTKIRLLSSADPIVSPFDDSGASSSSAAAENSAVATTTKGPLDLTWENVELVLDEMRPYLIQDGGNVAIQEIDGPVVRLELQVRQ